MPVIHVMPPVVAFGVPAGGVHVPLPLLVAGLGIEGTKKACQVIHVSADSRDDVILDHERSHR